MPFALSFFSFVLLFLFFPLFLAIQHCACDLLFLVVSLLFHLAINVLAYSSSRSVHCIILERLL
jgi:hypothetical protein